MITQFKKKTMLVFDIIMRTDYFVIYLELSSKGNI